MRKKKKENKTLKQSGKQIKLLPMDAGFDQFQVTVDTEDQHFCFSLKLDRIKGFFSSVIGFSRTRFPFFKIWRPEAVSSSVLLSPWPEVKLFETRRSDAVHPNKGNNRDSCRKRKWKQKLTVRPDLRESKQQNNNEQRETTREKVSFISFSGFFFSVFIIHNAKC